MGLTKHMQMATCWQSYQTLNINVPQRHTLQVLALSWIHTLTDFGILIITSNSSRLDI